MEKHEARQLGKTNVQNKTDIQDRKKEIHSTF